MRKITAIILVLLFAFALSYSADKANVEGTSLDKVMIGDQAQIDVNQIRAWLTNSGSFFRNPFTGNSGLEFPIESNVYAIYASGLWLGGLVTDNQGNTEPRVAIAEYSYEYNPGTMNIADGSWNDPSDARFRMYKITKDDYLAYTDGDDATVPGDDWMDWPVDDGAPTQDWNGEKIPLLLGDQTLWTVYNDADPNIHVNMGSAPLGLEVSQLTWGYNKPGALGNTIFTKFTVINKSTHPIDSCYISVWSDPDLGDSGDDFVGCDTLQNMGFVYNSSNVDGEYGSAPPAAGYVYFQGPIVPSVGDSAIFNFGKKADYKNLGMSSFIYYNNAHTNNGNVYFPKDVYNYQKALWIDGTPITFGGDGTGGTERAYFMFPSDPENPTGDVWLDVAPGDRRFLQNAGPVTMAVGDTQEVVIGIVAARGGSNLGSVTKLKNYAQFAQKAFDINFKLPNGPNPLNITASNLDREVVITWDDAVESYDEMYLAIPETDADGNPLQRDYRFQGYLVYQYPSNAFSDGKVIATYDLPGDDIKTIWDFTFDNTVGTYVNKPIINGKDSGIKRFIKITEDKYTNLSSKRLINGRRYFFGVQAYAYTPDGPDGEKIIFSPIAKITAEPQGPSIGTRYYASYGDTLDVVKVGESDGTAMVWVVDPSKLTGLDYTITFEEDTIAADGSFFWKVVRSDGETVLDYQKYQSDSLNQNETFTVFDGLLAKVSGPPLSVKSFETVANAAGPIDPPTGAAADYYDYPVPERPGASQQVGDGKWFITVLDNAIGIDFAGFLARAFQYTGGYGNASGIHHLIPRDYEIRFTATGGKAFDNWGTGTVIDVPFELWDVGKVDDPSDDFQLFPYILDNDANAEFNLMYDAADPAGDTGWADHPISSASNDPYTDGIYWMHPTDNTPGTQGYDNLVAALEADPTGAAAWYSAPGWYPGAYDSWSGMHRMTLVNWNGGDVTTAASPADYNQAMPEVGTVFRIITYKINTDAVQFTFSAPAAATAKTADQKADMKKINVYPNPYYGAHSGEANQFSRWVRFTHLPPTCTIRVFNLAGELVRKIERINSDAVNENWDLLNTYGLPIASGIYIYHVEAPGVGEKIGKLTVFTPEQRLNTY